MKWLFGERFCLETKLKPDFVVGILRDYVDRTHWQSGDAVIGPEPLFDRLSGEGEGRFVLCPSSQLRRNGFRPIWRCELEGDETGSKLRVRAGSPGMVLFFVIWFVFFGYWGYRALRGWVLWEPFTWALGASVIFLLVGALCFWIPERDARAVLQRILGGTFHR